jgi:hypothetical protein
MAFLHETQTLESIRDRLSGPGSDSPRRWVKMSIDQMLHHVNLILEWSRCRTLLREIGARPLIGEWPGHAGLGDVGGTYHSRINAKHLDQHLKQFIA